LVRKRGLSPRMRAILEFGQTKKRNRDLTSSAVKMKKSEHQAFVQKQKPKKEAASRGRSSIIRLLQDGRGIFDYVGKGQGG